MPRVSWRFAAPLAHHMPCSRSFPPVRTFGIHPGDCTTGSRGRSSLRISLPNQGGRVSLPRTERRGVVSEHRPATRGVGISVSQKLPLYRDIFSWSLPVWGKDEGVEKM